MFEVIWKYEIYFESIETGETIQALILKFKMSQIQMETN